MSEPTNTKQWPFSWTRVASACWVESLGLAVVVCAIELEPGTGACGIRCGIHFKYHEWHPRSLVRWNALGTENCSPRSHRRFTEEVAGLKRHDCDHATALIRFLAAYRSCEGGDDAETGREDSRGYDAHSISMSWDLELLRLKSRPQQVSRWQNWRSSQKHSITAKVSPGGVIL